MIMENRSVPWIHLWDITDRKKMEEELRIKDFAIASSIDAIVIADLAGNITYVNNAFLKMWGDDASENTPDEIIGKSAISFAKDRVKAENVFEKVLDKGSWYGEIEGVKKDGTPIIVLFSANLVADENQEAICMMGSFVDITDRKIAEKKLESVNEALEQRVAERTRELLAANRRMQKEIEERKQVETSLRQKEEELRQQSLNLQETNTALKILLKQRGPG
jgi:PAS domain S-box-containing protein